MRRALIFTLLCALASCAFEVKLGSSPPPVGGGGGGGFLGSTCSAPQLFAYEVTLEPTPIPPSCWFDGGTQVTLAEERFTAVFLHAPISTFATGPTSTQTLALVGLGPQLMGNAAPVKLGEAVGGNDTVFDWDDTLIQWQPTGTASNVLNTRAQFVFDRLDTTLTAGTVHLRSQWTCVPDGDGGCPPPLSFVPSCEFDRRFLAQRTDVPAGWVAEPAELIPGAQQVIASLDTGALEETGTFCWGSPGRWLIERHVPAMRRIERWQFEPTTGTLHVPRRTLILGDAPAITYGPTLSLLLNPQARVELTTQPDAEEQRVTRLVVNSSDCTFGITSSSFSRPSIGFESQWRCRGSGCTTVAGTDHGWCAGSFEFFTIPLESFIATSP